MLDMIKAVFKRFLKGFLAGGVAQVALILGPGINIHNMDDLKALVTTLIFGFIVGGLLAIDKGLSWYPSFPPSN